MADENESKNRNSFLSKTLRAPYLLILSADGTWTSLSLPSDGAVTIGSDPEADVRLDEPAASRRHARLEVAGTGELRLVDLESPSGIRVGDKLVSNAALKVRPGEPIQIGRTVLAVHALSPAKSGPPPPSQPGYATMAEVDALIARIAPKRTDVLLLGETGVGKGVIAKRIHDESTRARAPFLQINCAGLSATLLASDLFGHKKGAFSGAEKDKKGLLEVATDGTVFLDEIGEMPLEVQAKLLVAIEQHVIWPVGATESTPTDVRFIFATHRDLSAEIRKGQFRADFYHRINQFPISIPPLRERRDEIDRLVSQFASEYAAGSRAPTFDEEARAWLHRYDWPGNIRELRYLVERAVTLTDGDVVTSSILVAASRLPAHMLPLEAGSVEEEKRRRVVEALAECGGNQSRAARKLRISRNTLRAWIKRYGIPCPRPKDDP